MSEPPVGSPPTDLRRERIGWYFYDWANSAFPTTVLAVFLGPYLTSVARSAADPSGFVYPLGIPVHSGAFFSYVVSLSAFLQVFTLPVLGAIADYSHRKKQMLGLFAYLGAIATMGLYLVQGTNYLLGGGLFILANLCFGASVVFYNAFLPELAGPEERDAVSSRGWAMGFLGGGLLLALNVLLFSQAPALGLGQGQAVQISLASAGVWWAIFTVIPLATLRTRQPIRRLPPGQGYLTAGFRQLRHTLGRIHHYPHTLLFLAAYLLYNDGIQAVIALSSQFGQEELGLPISTLTTVILVVQFTAILGALGFGRLAGLLGARRAIMLSLLVWAGVLVYAYGFLFTAAQFYLLGVVIALVLGGSQALSRSLFSQMIPRGQEAEYFSVYEIGERGTSWLAPLLFGLTLQFTDNYRLSILVLIVFFILGLALLSRVDVRRAATEAGNQPPPRV